MNTIKRLLLPGLALALLAGGASSASAQTLFSDSFSYADGVVTSEKAYYSGTCPCSPVWEMNSGTLYASGGRGWSGAPNTTNNSAVFRLNTKAKTFQNVAVTFRLLNQGVVTTSRTPAQSYDGVHVWLRYGAEEGPLYALSINRRDGVALIKKKLPGGSTNGGSYATIGQTRSYPVRYGQWVNVKATALNNSDGSVTLELFADGVKLVSVRDASAPIRSAGAIGIRGDNCNFMIDDLAVATLGGSTSGGTTTQGAPVATAVKADALTTSGAHVTWTTDKVSHSQVEYGLTAAYGAKTGMSSATGLYHGTTLSGLQAGKTYHYRVLSKDDATGLTGVSGDYTLTTKAAASAAPAISAVQATGVTSAGATLTWTTDKVSHSQAEYGPTTSYGSQTGQSTAAGLYHSVTLTGLKAGTLYHYRVKSLDDATKLTGVSQDFTFTTSGSAGSAAGAPATTNAVVSGITSNGAIVTWQTDKASHSQAQYGPTSSYGSLTARSADTGLWHKSTLSGLQPGTTYKLRTMSLDPLTGLTGYSQELTFTTSGGATPAPAPSAVISDVRTQNVSATGAEALWTTTTNSHSQAEYGLTTAYGSLSKQSADTGRWHKSTLSGLQAGRTYHYRVRSLDPATGQTAVSGDYTFTTPASATTSAR
jgi:hypothetical protein